MRNKIVLVSESWGEKVVILDEEDYDRVVQFHWTVTRRGKIFHAMRKINHYDTIFMHRFILGLKYMDGTLVDHINGNGLDNRKSNLRIATKRINALNSDRSRNARLIEPSGRYRWRLRPSVNGVRKNLGTFDTEEAALEAAQRYRDGCEI